MIKIYGDKLQPMLKTERKCGFSPFKSYFVSKNTYFQGNQINDIDLVSLQKVSHRKLPVMCYFVANSVNSYEASIFDLTFIPISQLIEAAVYHVFILLSIPSMHIAYESCPLKPYLTSCG